MNDSEIAKEIYRVQRERREDIERSTTSLGHEEKKLSAAAHTELCRYVLLGAFGYVSFCLLNFTKAGLPIFLEAVVFVGALAIAISVLGMFLNSQAHFQQGDYHYHDALYQLKQMANDATAVTAKQASEMSWKLAENYRKYSMVCFYFSLLLFLVMFLLSIPLVNKYSRASLEHLLVGTFSLRSDNPF